MKFGMKFGAVVPCLNDFRFLPAVVGQLRRVCKRVLVVRNRRAFSGTSVDLASISPSLDATVLVGEWLSEHATRNVGLRELSDCDYIFTLDADEVLLDDDLDYLVRVCREGAGRHRALGARLHTYWKTPEYRIDPPEFLVAPVVVRRGERFVSLRRLQDGAVQLARPWVHHLSWVRTDDEVREKLRLFAHADEVKPRWFEDIWKRWDEDREMPNLHPVYPTHYQRAIVDPDPSLLETLKKWGCA